MTYSLGTLTFGGQIVFDTHDTFTVELPCGVYIQIRKTQPAL